MMTWLTALVALLRITKAVLDYVSQRQLIEAGKAAQIKENLNASLALLKKVDKARSDAVAKFDASGGVPDSSDPNLRD
jgi:hypothetical protein